MQSQVYIFLKFLGIKLNFRLMSGAVRFVIFGTIND